MSFQISVQQDTIWMKKRGWFWKFPFLTNENWKASKNGSDMWTNINETSIERLGETSYTLTNRMCDIRSGEWIELRWQLLPPSLLHIASACCHRNSPERDVTRFVFECVENESSRFLIENVFLIPEKPRVWSSVSKLHVAVGSKGAPSGGVRRKSSSANSKFPSYPRTP